MTPVEAIIGHDPTDGEPIFNEYEAAVVLKRLTTAGYAIVPKEPTEAMLKAAGMTDIIAILNGLIALGAVHSGRSDSSTAQIYRAMVAAQPG